ncbi:MAG: DUF4258 domain-containing protein [Caldilineaceae bacterium]
MNESTYHLSAHAEQEIIRRGITAVMIDAVMMKPDQIIESHSERLIYQSKIEIDGKLYLVRAIVERTEPLTIVTAYRTSKVVKYWGDEDESNV